MSKSVKLLLACITLLLVTALAHATSLQCAQEAGLPTQGVVVETMNTDGYTYLCLENSGVQAWAIIREADVFVGEEVEIADGPVKSNFTSKSLNRTFDSLIFSRGIIKHLSIDTSEFIRGWSRTAPFLFVNRHHWSRYSLS